MTEEVKEAASLNLNIDDLALDQNGKLTHLGWNNVIGELLKLNPLWIRKFNQKRDITENDKIAAIKENPMILAYIQNPSEELQKLAVSLNPNTFRFIKRPSEAVAREALFSKTALKNKGEPIWDEVKKKFKRFSNSLASELADSDVYAEKAYNDYGIYRKDIKTSKGLFGLGKEKQKGGELVNKNSIFNKLARKLKSKPKSINKSANTTITAEPKTKAVTTKKAKGLKALESVNQEHYDFWYKLLAESTKEYLDK